MRALKPWVMRIQHPAQHALSGGVVLACSRIAWTTECAQVGLSKIWGLSIDFAKMFNSLSPHVAAAVAGCMGLALDNIRDLALPILRAKGVWRLPKNCEPEVFVNSRGLPQGMASSVLLAEVAISPLLWRLSLHDSTLSMWSYVDDLNLCADSVPKLLEAWAYIQEFAVDFCLSIATHKCSVWINSKSQREEVHRETGLEVTDSFLALVENGLSPNLRSLPTRRS